MLQDAEAIADLKGRRTFDYQNYQVTVTEIEVLTGLEFADEIYETNPLLYHPNDTARSELNVSHFPERVEVDSSAEIIDENTPRDFFADDVIDVFIAAAMVNPEGADRGNEWISIINLEGNDVDLSGWTISDTKRGPLELGTVLAPADRVLSPGTAVSIRPISPLMLTNSGGTICLYRDPDAPGTPAKRVDRVTYTKKDLKEPGIPVVFTGRFRQ